MGPKMCPSIPDSVNSGTKPAMMMAAAKKIDWLTSAAAMRNRAHLAAKAAAHAHAVQGGWVRVPRCADASARCRIDVLDHDDGGIHHQPEIDGADRQQVRRFAAQHHEPDGEGQRERYGHRDDHGAAQIAEKRPLQQKDEHDARHHVVQHGVRGDVDQIAAVVDALDADAGRQDAALVDLVHFRFDALDGGHALARRGA